jgi:hypothetical protein
MKRLLTLLFMLNVIIACNTRTAEPDLTGNLTGTYVHIYKYDRQDIQEETRWVITKSGERSVQLLYRIEPTYTGTSPGTISLDPAIEVLLTDIKITAANQFQTDQVKEVLYGKKVARTRINIQAFLKDGNLNARMLFVDEATGNATSQEFLMERR